MNEKIDICGMKPYCNGCAACINRCQAGALQLKQDTYGYYRAYLDESVCLNCGECLNICPLENTDFRNSQKPDCFAVQAEDKLRKKSSSGGIFTLLAEEILEKGGVVCGAAWSEGLEVAHVVVHSKQQLHSLRGSKYVQSRIGYIFRQIKGYLDAGKIVLFSGCPCQVAGLYAYLGRDYETLYTADILCFYAPSPGWFQKHMVEKLGTGNTLSINMRDKENGWNCTTMRCTLVNGQEHVLTPENDEFEKAFHSILLKNSSCEHCVFAKLPRIGDITLGDFWHIGEYIPALDDDRGTSAVLVNNDKGKWLMSESERKFRLCKQASLDWLRGNRISNHVTHHPARDRFFELSTNKSFDHSVRYALEDRYDVGVVGCWNIKNYGSHVTYYALYKILKSWGLEPLLIGPHRQAPCYTTGCPELFKVNPYRTFDTISGFDNKEDMGRLNTMADCFIVGSDQLWHPWLYHHFGDIGVLDFIEEEKIKIAYGTSFGRSEWEGTDEERLVFTKGLKTFDHISVRESSGVKLCQKEFDVTAQWVLDPIFLCPRNEFEALVDRSSLSLKEPFITAYILDADPEKERVMTCFSEALRLPLVTITDPNEPKLESWTLPCEIEFSVEDWLLSLRDCELIITDSFHGMCLAIYFNKQFVVFPNERRGIARFDDYGDLLGIRDHYLQLPCDDFNIEDYLIPLPYDRINKVLAAESERSKRWLAEAIFFERISCMQDKEINNIDDAVVQMSDYDVISFDVFDTLITRRLLKPDDLFNLIGKLVQSDCDRGLDFLTLRKAAEAHAMARKGSFCSIEEIYQSFPIFCDCTAQQAETWKRLEIEAELRLCIPRQDMLELFNRLKRLGKEIILVSDMYLTADIISDMLKKCGYTGGWEHIFVSCQVGARKDDGGIWPMILEHCSGRSLIHCGDNAYSDLTQPRTYGIKARLIPNPGKAFESSQAYKDLKKEELSKLENSLLMGLIINSCLYNKAFGYSKDGLPQLHSPDELGYSAFGPIFALFCQWLSQQELEGAHLLFLSREGYLLKQLFEEFCKLSGIREDFVCSYLLASRRAISFALAESREYVGEILSTSYNGSLLTLLRERFSLDSCIMGKIDDAFVTLPEDRTKIIAILEPYLPDVFKQAEAEATAYKKYFDSIVSEHPGKKLFVVDLGFSGSMQYLLSLLTGNRIDGFYVACGANKKPEKLGFQCDSLYGEKQLFNTISPLIFEGAMQAPFGQLVRFAGSEPEPVFKTDSEVSPHIKRLQDGIRKFVNDYAVSICGCTGVEMPNKLLASVNFECVISGKAAEQCFNLSYSVNDEYCNDGSYTITDIRHPVIKYTSALQATRGELARVSNEYNRVHDQQVLLKEEIKLSISEKQAQIDHLQERIIEIEKAKKIMEQSMQTEIQGLLQKLEMAEISAQDLRNEVSRVQTSFNAQIRSEEQRIAELLVTEMELNRIRTTRSWRYMGYLWKFRDVVVPYGSKRRRVVKWAVRSAKAPFRLIQKPKREKSPYAASVSETLTAAKQIASQKNSSLPAPKIADKVSSVPLAFGVPTFFTTENNYELPPFPLRLFPQPTGATVGDYESLQLPQWDSPVVSIIIPAYNQFAYTYNCIRSIVENDENIPYEIILADDCSNDLTKNIEDIISGIMVVRTSENIRFLKNCNNAARYAKGDYVLFLNNDTQVQKGWLESLVSLIERDLNIGMVGSKLVYPNGQLQEAGCILWKADDTHQYGSAWNFGHLCQINLPMVNYVHEADYISGASIMIRKSIWKDIGGFDDRFAPAYCEDSDLAMEIRKRGYKVVVQPASVVVHFEGVSNGTDLSAGQKSYQIINTQKLYEKWREVFEREHFSDNTDVFWARDRSRDKKCLLVIDWKAPAFDQDAGSRTTFQYLKLFVDQGFNVKFIGDDFVYDEKYTVALQQMGIEVLFGPWFQSHWMDWINGNGKYIQYVLFNRSSVTKKYIDYIRAHTNARLIFYGHDLNCLRLERQYQYIRTDETLKNRKTEEYLEFTIMRKSDVSYYPSQVEVDIIKTKDASVKVRTIPAYIFEKVPDVDYDYMNRSNIMMVGGFGFWPNADGLTWFIQNVMPKLAALVPGVMLNVIGSNIPSNLYELADENVVFLGFLPDDELQVYYSKCRMAVAPLRVGAGVKGKVVEAMMHGLPVATTTIGAEGLLGAENILCVEDDPNSLAEKIAALYVDEYRLCHISQDSIAYVREHFSTESALKAIAIDFDLDVWEESFL